ncbi:MULTISPECIES: pentapeptide repeat-containing protein [Leptolyngbya]|uniref:pentapeptide repeat-containing protein n=1 Tax=Leptolyngbya TaxID=47251 RepID=UPI00168567C5|nr:pentapeptide repeat-containing protein [Leptolyngbya sp. FACHB-1624]MBD1855156.1 pentapeptide repeat-containing protein [Leptolyngbya sp. FACHB-1624]
MTHYINHDLRNRSFRRKNLAFMNFRGADIRGCDFTGAILSGADFSDTKAGLSLRQRFYLGGFVIFVSLFVGDVMVRLLFNTIGQPPLDPRTIYVPIFYAATSLAGVSSAIAAVNRKSELGDFLTSVTAVLVSAIVGFGVGFFYPGLIQTLIFPPNVFIPSTSEWLHQLLLSLDEHHIQIAVGLTVLTSVMMLFLSRFQYRTSFKVGVSLLGAIASYVATFFWSTIANAYFGNSNFSLGIVFSIITLMYLGLTFVSLNWIVYELQHAIGTSFRGAELTHARFAYADLRNTDFSKSIGASALK